MLIVMNAEPSARCVAVGVEGEFMNSIISNEPYHHNPWTRREHRSRVVDSIRRLCLLVA